MGFRDVRLKVKPRQVGDLPGLIYLIIGVIFDMNSPLMS